MWIQCGVLVFLFVIASLVAWYCPAGSRHEGLRESAWRALDGSIRDLIDYRYSDEGPGNAAVAGARGFLFALFFEDVVFVARRRRGADLPRNELDLGLNLDLMVTEILDMTACLSSSE